MRYRRAMRRQVVIYYTDEHHTMIGDRGLRGNPLTGRPRAATPSRGILRAPNAIAHESDAIAGCCSTAAGLPFVCEKCIGRFI